MLVTDGFLRKSGITKKLELAIERSGVRLSAYDRTKANPTAENVEEARTLYVENSCLIAFGGDSSIDCAKASGARIAYPKRSLDRLRRNLRVLKKIPSLVAIPIMAGTGSEVTLSAVITDADRHYKYTMNDFALIPTHAILDPEVTFTLSPSLTATTGMDALTYAIEVYIGRSTNKETRRMLIEAVRLIFSNIETAYDNGANCEARKDMLRAAYLAGAAFSKSYAGYIHAIAHSPGGRYNTPHGLANSVLLPCCLVEYGEPYTPSVAWIGSCNGTYCRKRLTCHWRKEVYR